VAVIPSEVNKRLSSFAYAANGNKLLNIWHSCGIRYTEVDLKYKNLNIAFHLILVTVLAQCVS